MYLAAIVRYDAPEEELAKHNAEHRAYMRGFFEQGKLVVAGPFVPRSGGLLIFNVEDRAELDAMLEDEPFHKRGYYTLEVHEWGPTLGAEGFAQLAERP